MLVGRSAESARGNPVGFLAVRPRRGGIWLIATESRIRASVLRLLGVHEMAEDAARITVPVVEAGAVADLPDGVRPEVLGKAGASKNRTPSSPRRPAPPPCG